MASVGKSWLYALVVTAYNLYANVYQPNLAAGRVAPAAGSGLMIVVALLLLAAAASATTGSGRFGGIGGGRRSSRSRPRRGPDRTRRQRSECLSLGGARSFAGAGVGGCPDEEAFAKMRETVRRAHNDWDVPLTFQR